MLKRQLNLGSLPSLCKNANFEGFQTVESNKAYPPNAAGADTLFLVFEGVLSFEEGGKKISVAEGEYYIQKANTQIGSIPIEGKPFYFYFNFNGDFGEDLGINGLPAKGEFKKEEILPLCTLCSMEKGRRLFEVNYIFQRVLRRLYSFNQNKSGNLYDDVVSYIKNNISEVSSLEQVCKILGYSNEYIIRIFKKNSDKTPYQFITEQKIELAKEIIRGGAASIHIVAEICGWNDVTSFSRSFKRVCGISPTEWKKLNSRN